MTSSAGELQTLKAEWERREKDRRAREAEELDRLQAEAARRHLADFLRAAWPVIEPSAPLVWGWHIDAICEHLEAVTRGQIQNLLITLPPGCTKSILVGVMWPAWVWASDPSVRWLFAANEGDLATRDSLACRNVVQSEWYKKHFPHVELVSDQNVKTWFQTSGRGHRQALTVRSSVIGKKGDVLVVDDPNKAESESEAEREQVIRWWRSFYNRVNDYKTSRRVVIGQRTHRGDLQNYLIAGGAFEELSILEEHEPHRRRITSIGWTDPRAKEGEWLRPERFGAEQKAEAIATLGSAGYAAQHQQQPLSAEGYRFKAAWLKRRWRFDPTSPDFVILEDDRGPYRFKFAGTPLFATIDPASSSKRTADDTAVGVWASSPRGDLLWVGCEVHKLDIPDQPKLLEELYGRWQFRTVGIEGVASNSAMFQFAQRLHLAALRLTPKGLDKLAHASGALILAEAGSLWLPDPESAPGFPMDKVVTQLLEFTGTGADANDDIVDVLSYAVDMRPKVSSGSARVGMFAPGSATNLAATPRGPGVGPRVPSPLGR